MEPINVMKVGKALLTPKAVETLEYLQGFTDYIPCDDPDGAIRNYSDVLHQVTSLLIIVKNEPDAVEKDGIDHLLLHLCYLEQNLRNLRRP